MGKKSLVILLFAFALIVFIIWKTPVQEVSQIPIATDRPEYNLGEFPVITVQNNSGSSICFSECYRYYLEIKNGEWARYPYDDCPWPDLIKRCIDQEEAVGFELIIDEAKIGLHRTSVPVCLDCQIGEDFRKDQMLYSNEFVIN